MSKEFLVNSYRGQWQDSPDIARLNNGGFVVVWRSFFFEDDLDLYYIAGQRFSASGKKIGGEFIVDDDMVIDEGASSSPSVTALGDGGFAVGWENSRDGVLGSTDVYTRAFDADGDARGGSIRAHARDPEDQKVPELSATKNGYFLSYTSYDGTKPSQQENVYLQRFDNDGDRVGGASRINQLTQFDQQCSQSAKLSDGATVVIWDSEYGGRDIPGAIGLDGVKGRIYGPGGKPLTGEFMVSDDNGQISSAISPDTSIDVAALSGGRFVASWYETKLNGDRDTTFEIHARLFDGDGDALGKELIVRSTSDGVPRHSSVIGLDNGTFVVAWDEPGASGEFQEAYARVYGKAGLPLGAAFKLHPASGGSDQEFPELAPLKGGGFFAVYESEFLDGDDDAIAGRLFELGTAGRDSASMRAPGTLHAFGGDDRLIGSRGSDTLDGGAGDDVIRGGRGGDVLIGADGADRFVFGRVAASSSNAPDRIVDFDSAFDLLDLSRVDADAGRAGNQAFAFIGAHGFGREAGELRYAGGRLLGDVDGDGHADIRIDVAGLHAEALIL